MFGSMRAARRASVRGALTPQKHLAKILTDFAKLTDLTAMRKVMMFSFRPDMTFEQVVSHCTVLAQPLQPGESYLLCGWPGDASWANRVEALQWQELPSQNSS